MSKFPLALLLWVCGWMVIFSACYAALEAAGLT